MKPSNYIPLNEQPPYPPCTRSNCDCSNCLNFRAAADRVPEAAARPAETATQYLARRDALEAPLRNCGCAHCCETLARFRAADYAHPCENPATVHCTTPDGRNYYANFSGDEIREIVRACVVDCIAALYPRARPGFFRETIDAAAAKAVRAAVEVPPQS